MVRKCLVLVLLTLYSSSCGSKYFEQEVFGVKESVWETLGDEERKLVIDAYGQENELAQTVFPSYQRD